MLSVLFISLLIFCSVHRSRVTVNRTSMSISTGMQDFSSTISHIRWSTASRRLPLSRSRPANSRQVLHHFATRPRHANLYFAMTTLLKIRLPFDRKRTICECVFSYALIYCFCSCDLDLYRWPWYTNLT